MDMNSDALWMAVIAIIGWGATMSVLLGRQERGQLRRSLNQALEAWAAIWFLGSIFAGAAVMAVVGRWWPRLGGDIMIGSVGTALLLQLTIMVRTIRAAVRQARQRSQESGLIYRAMAPGWVVGLSVSLTVLVAVIAGGTVAGDITTPWLRAYLMQAYMQGGDAAVGAATVSITKLTEILAVVAIGGVFVLGPVAGMWQRYRIARRDAQYEQVMARISAAAGTHLEPALQR